MRVVHVIGDLKLGGAEALLYRLVTHPLPGIEQEVICLGDREWYSDRLAQRGVPVHYLGMTSAATVLRSFAALRGLIRDSRADVIQSWMYFANLLAGIAAPPGTPVVWGIHNSSLDDVRMASRFCAYAAGAASRRLADYVVNCSSQSADLHGRFGYSAVPNAVIPNGYDPTSFIPDEKSRNATRAALGIDDETFLVGSISRWHPQKDIPNLLRAVRLASERALPMRCLLIGRGLDGCNVDLARAIEAAGCADLVEPLGLRADVDELARALDLHVLPSRSEAFPNVVAETMLSGTPNAVTDVGDSALMVGDSGWVVSAADPEALAEAVEQAWREWRDRPLDWARRRAAARESIVERFTFERMAEAYADVWRQLTKQRAN